MASRVITQLISDLSGEVIKDGKGETVQFSYRGSSYAIDLTDKEAAGFDKAIATYLENATKQGSGAMDLATITCEAVLKSDKKDEEGMGLILMWIAGYHAGTHSDSVFDSDAFTKSMTEIGEKCGQNPKLGLMTVSDQVMGE